MATRNAFYYRDGWSIEGWNVSEWQLNENERWAILEGATIYLYVWTFGRAMQPINLAVRGVTEASNGVEA